MKPRSKYGQEIISSGLRPTARTLSDQKRTSEILKRWKMRELQTDNESDTGGTKHDDDKTNYCYMSPIFLEEVNKVLTFGAKKYEAHNWRGGFIWSRPLSACFRHLYSFMRGEDRDPETGLLHLAHAACCIMFLVEFYVTKKGVDDRYKIEDDEGKRLSDLLERE
jgi:hypothetical protein